MENEKQREIEMKIQRVQREREAMTAKNLMDQHQKLLQEVREECQKRKVMKKELAKEIEDERVRITLLEVRKDEREKRVKQRIIKNEQMNKDYEPTLQDREDIKELKKEKEDLLRSRKNYMAMQKRLGDLVMKGKDEERLELGRGRDNFTIVNKEVVDPESYDVNSKMLPEAKVFPGTNWKWNQFNMKRLMMNDVKEHVQKMANDAISQDSFEEKLKQNKLVKRLFKKRIVQFDILPDMSDKKKKLTRIANAIIVAARKMKEHNITLEELMSGEKSL